MSTRPTDLTPSLLPPQATALERDLEQATARMANVPTPFATLWNHATCPADLLGWLAWANSVDEWDTNWPEEIKREAIRIAPLLHQCKGTVWALQNALKPLGTFTTIEEWWAMNPPGAPGTFRATTLISRTDLTGNAQAPLLTPALTEKIKAVIDCNKPASRSYSLRIGVGLKKTTRTALVMRPAAATHADIKPKTTHTAVASLRTTLVARVAQSMHVSARPGATRMTADCRIRSACAVRLTQRYSLTLLPTGALQ